MEKLRKNKLFFWCGLFVIVVLFCVYYIFFLYGVAPEMPLRGRHVIKFLFILMVYASGAVCLHRFAVHGMVAVWHVVYLGVLSLLILLGIYDWAIARTPLSVREIADTLQEFLISPILYVAIGIISERAHKRP